MDNFQARDGNGSLFTRATQELPGQAHADKVRPVDASGASIDFATQTTLIALLEAVLGLQSASGHAEITPDDDTVLTGVRALRIGGGGDIVITIDGVDVPYPVSDGEVLQVKAERVKATGTTATDIVAWL